MPRQRGVPNRNFPAMSLQKALDMPRALQEGASGMPTDRLTLSQLLDKSPSSSGFITLILASRGYGLTTGGKNATEFALTNIGRAAVSDDPAERQQGLRTAVLSVEPFRAFLVAYDQKKVPLPAALTAFLTNQAGVPVQHVDQCIAHLLADARLAGLLRKVKAAEYVDLKAPAGQVVEPLDEMEADETDDGLGEEAPAYGLVESELSMPPGSGEPSKRPSAIFLGHGKNKKPLEQLTRILEEYKIPYRIAVDEANQGRPISQKVADVMDQCGAAILIFTADQELQDANGNTIWRPSENVVYELGAAAVKYGSRIIIFKEEAVDFPTNFRDIGHISFAKDQLDSKGMDLFRELIAFGLVAFSVPSE